MSGWTSDTTSRNHHHGRSAFRSNFSVSAPSDWISAENIYSMTSRMGERIHQLTSSLDTPQRHPPPTRRSHTCDPDPVTFDKTVRMMSHQALDNHGDFELSHCQMSKRRSCDVFGKQTDPVRRSTGSKTLPNEVIDNTRPYHVYSRSPKINKVRFNDQENLTCSQSNLNGQNLHDGRIIEYSEHESKGRASITSYLIHNENKTTNIPSSNYRPGSELDDRASRYQSPCENKSKHRIKSESTQKNDGRSHLSDTNITHFGILKPTECPGNSSISLDNPRSAFEPFVPHREFPALSPYANKLMAMYSNDSTPTAGEYMTPKQNKGSKRDAFIDSKIAEEEEEEEEGKELDSPPKQTEKIKSFGFIDTKIAEEREEKEDEVVVQEYKYVGSVKDFEEPIQADREEVPNSKDNKAYSDVMSFNEQSGDGNGWNKISKLYTDETSNISNTLSNSTNVNTIHSKDMVVNYNSYDVVGPNEVINPSSNHIPSHKTNNKHVDQINSKNMVFKEKGHDDIDRDQVNTSYTDGAHKPNNQHANDVHSNNMLFIARADDAIVLNQVRQPNTHHVQSHESNIKHINDVYSTDNVFSDKDEYGSEWNKVIKSHTVDSNKMILKPKPHTHSKSDHVKSNYTNAIEEKGGDSSVQDTFSQDTNSSSDHAKRQISNKTDVSTVYSKDVKLAERINNANVREEVNTSYTVHAKNHTSIKKQVNTIYSHNTELTELGSNATESDVVSASYGHLAQTQCVKNDTPVKTLGLEPTYQQLSEPGSQHCFKICCKTRQIICLTDKATPSTRPLISATIKRKEEILQKFYSARDHIGLINKAKGLNIKDVDHNNDASTNLDNEVNDEVWEGKLQRQLKERLEMCSCCSKRYPNGTQFNERDSLEADTEERSVVTRESNQSQGSTRRRRRDNHGASKSSICETCFNEEKSQQQRIKKCPVPSKRNKSPKCSSKSTKIQTTKKNNPVAVRGRNLCLNEELPMCNEYLEDQDLFILHDDQQYNQQDSTPVNQGCLRAQDDTTCCEPCITLCVEGNGEVTTRDDVCNDVCDDICDDVCDDLCENACDDVCNDACDDVCDDACGDVCNDYSGDDTCCNKLVDSCSQWECGMGEGCGTKDDKSGICELSVTCETEALDLRFVVIVFLLGMACALLFQFL